MAAAALGSAAGASSLDVGLVGNTSHNPQATARMLITEAPRRNSRPRRWGAVGNAPPSKAWGGMKGARLGTVAGRDSAGAATPAAGGAGDGIGWTGVRGAGSPRFGIRGSTHDGTQSASFPKPF